MQPKPDSRALRQIHTDAIHDLLGVAQHRGYVAAILDLEIELSARNDSCAAAREYEVPLVRFDAPAPRCLIALARMRSAAARQAYHPFTANMVQLHPSNFAEAWQLASGFENVEERANAFVAAAFWIISHCSGPNAAVETMLPIEKLPPGERIELLESAYVHNFSNLRDVSRSD